MILEAWRRVFAGDELEAARVQPIGDLEEPLTALFGSYGDDLELKGFDPIFVGSLLGIGGFLGVSGAMIASNQRLKGLEVV